MISVDLTLSAQFYDLDPMGIVWHGNYAKFFEQARCDLLNKVKFGYAEMEKSGYSWPIVDMRIKYIRSIRFDQIFIVTATLSEYLNRIKIDYVIRDKATDEILTKAQTIQVAVDNKNGELQLETPLMARTKIEAML